MIQKRSRIKINTDLAKIRQAGKNPQEAAIDQQYQP